MDAMLHVLTVLVFTSVLVASNASHPPNIVLILADDIGMGDIGCFGNTTMKTPHIDSIARQGATLTHHLAAASVCTPSRAAFLTGRYPIRMGMISSNFVRVSIFPSVLSGMPPSEVTVAELVKQKGYKTAIVGKWHLGVHGSNVKDFAHHPMSQGFDQFYGVPMTNLQDFSDDDEHVFLLYRPHMYKLMAAITIGAAFLLLFVRWTSRGGCCITILLLLPIIVTPCTYLFFNNFKFLASMLMRDYDVVEQPIRLYQNLTQRLVAEGVEFLEARAGDQSPFLLYLPWIQAHTALHTSKDFIGHSHHGIYGDNVEEMDWSVGEILNALDRLGFKDNTFVYFSSDNGPHNEERDFKGRVVGGYNSIYKGGKFQGGMEGGIRVPTLAMFPGRIPAGSTVDAPTFNMDLMPTVGELVGASMPTDRIVDGNSLLPLLTGKTTASSHEFFFHYCCTEIHAARYAPKDSDDVWKVHLATPNWIPGTQGCGYLCDCYGDAVTWHDPPLLYNIAKDPAELSLLDVTEPRNGEIFRKIKDEMEKHMASIEDHECQFSISKVLPRPWLHHCCNFPFCNCVDQKYIKE